MLSTSMHHRTVCPSKAPAAQQATSLALLEIAWHESGFRAKVEDCRITGDLPTRHSKINEGLAVSMFSCASEQPRRSVEFAQTKPPRPRRYSRELFVRATCSRQSSPFMRSCANRGRVEASTIPASVSGMFFTYASGKSGKTKAGQEHVEQFEAMMRKHGPCSSQRTARCGLR